MGSLHAQTYIALALDHPKEYLSHLHIHVHFSILCAVMINLYFDFCRHPDLQISKFNPEKYQFVVYVLNLVTTITNIGLCFYEIGHICVTV